MSIIDEVKPAVRAVLANWKPMLLIQLGAVGIVVVYYQSASMQAWCAHLATLKENGGLPFAAIAGAIAGGIVPEFAKLITKNKSQRQGVKEIACVAIYFAFMGLSVDILYSFFGRVWGMDHQPLTIVKKTCSDMGVFCPLIAVSTTVATLTWKDCGFSFSKTKEVFSNGGFWDRYIKVLLPNWIIWIPVVSAIYCLPVNLQFLTAQLAEAAWSIVVVHISQTVSQEA